MVHTNKNFAELQQGYRWGGELLSAQKNRGGQEIRLPCCAHPHWVLGVVGSLVSLTSSVWMWVCVCVQLAKARH